MLNKLVTTKQTFSILLKLIIVEKLKKYFEFNLEMLISYFVFKLYAFIYIQICG